MSRLPTVSGDGNAWGTVLNDFLSVAHNADGSLKNLFINVKDPAYGAVGDGVTDDASAINAAIAASPPGSTIWFPGNHLVGSAIQLLGGRSYRTSVTSSSGFTFKQKNGANLPAVVASSDWYNNATLCGDPMLIEDVVIDANSANNTTSHGLVLMNYGAVARRCTVKNAPANGILTTSVNRAGTNITNVNQLNRIEECVSNTAGSHGIYVQDNNGLLTDGYLENNVVSSSTGTAILLDRSAGWFIRYNHCYSCNVSAIVANNCWSTYIIGNEIDGYGQSATSGFYAGIDAELKGPRATIIEANIISVGSESNEATTYQHLIVDGADTVDTKAIVVGNHVQGGWVNTSSTSTVNSGTTNPCTPLSMVGIHVGQTLWINFTDNITVGSVTATTFTPNANWPHTYGPSSFSIFSSKSAGLSIGLLYASNATQQGSGLPCTIISTGNRVDAVGTYLYTEGYTTIGPVTPDGGIALPEGTARTAIATSGTITTKGVGTAVVNPGSAVTDIRLQAGTQAGQLVSVMNVSAYSITLNTAPFTANVADAATEPTIAANTSRMYLWDAQNALWYRVA